MKIYVFFCLIFFISISNNNAQSITLRVLGKGTFVEYAETNGMILLFNGNDFEEKKKKFEDEIASLGITSKLNLINSNIVPINKKKFRIEENNLVYFNKLLMICNNLNISVEKVYYKMPAHRFEDEDKGAILALKNATSQARTIANNLNYKIVKILNIDDETTYADPFYDNVDIESERAQMVVQLLQTLGIEKSSYNTESREPVREMGYNILVTYELEPM